jgi:hypothetical protein
MSPRVTWQSTQQIADRDPDAEYQLPGPVSSSPPPSPAGKVPQAEQRDILHHTPIGKHVKLPLLDIDIARARRSVVLSHSQFGTGLRRFGYMSVIDIAFQESRKAGHSFKTYHGLSDVAEWRVQGACLLADVPIRILQTLLDGNLANKVATRDPELHGYFQNRKDYWILRSRGDDFAPVIYVRIFKDVKGNSPSPAQLLTVLDLLEKYASGKEEHDELCADIDRQVGRGGDATSIRKGLHRFFGGSIDRVATLLTFVAALRQVLSEVPPEEHDRPFVHPLKYVGFSIKEYQRNVAHDNNNTSWLMPLFSCACKLAFHDSDGSAMFAFESFVVAYPINRVECRLGEELFARMCKSYYYNGLGFNIAEAGLSIGGTNLSGYELGEATKLWVEREKFRSASPVIEAQTEFDVQIQMPKWVQVLHFHSKTLDEHKADAEADLDASIVQYDAREPTMATCDIAFEAMVTKHRDEEEKIGRKRVREALHEVHERMERRVKEKLGLPDS